MKKSKLFLGLGMLLAMFAWTGTATAMSKNVCDYETNLDLFDEPCREIVLKPIDTGTEPEVEVEPEPEPEPLTAEDLGISETDCEYLNYGSCSEMTEEDLIALAQELLDDDDYIDTSAISGSGNVGYSGNENGSNSPVDSDDTDPNSTSYVPYDPYGGYDDFLPDFSEPDVNWYVPSNVIEQVGDGNINEDAGKRYDPDSDCSSKNEVGSYVGWCESDLNLRYGRD